MPFPDLGGSADPVAELVAREAIRDCLLRYARGCDRVDAELIASAFHDDAVDHHGPVNGSPADFLDWWLPQQDGRESTQHYLMNSAIEVDGDQAHAETYYLCVIKLKGRTAASVFGGRYVDRFERRAAGWRIAVRVVTADWTAEMDGSATGALLSSSPGRRSRDDPSYDRPLLRRSMKR
ncbi:MAG TPA: nuclear transport factor 2 family protein [Acidimicrobiales bacterium]|nr:nuclear transport factor 2 family protein [Acidimicrobiales bacterium]